MNVIQIYETDFGPVRLPSDFPKKGFRKNGAPDKRGKYAFELQLYFDSLNEAVRQHWVNGVNVANLRPLAWQDWLKKLS